MSKFTRLKSYLPLYQAADYLAEKISEEVLEADLIEAALRGSLKLSVYLKEYFYILVGSAKTEKSKFDSFEDNILYEEKPEIGLNVFYDLAMVGSEVSYLESRFEALREQPFEDVTFLEHEDGYILQDGERYVCLLQDFDKNPEVRGSEYYLGRQIEQIHNMGQGLSKNDSEYLTAKNDADRRRVLALDRHVEYAGMTLVKERVLPDGASLQVSIQRLDALARVLNEEHAVHPVSDLNARERNTILFLLAAMCKQANFDYSQRGISKAIEAATEEMGARVSDDTIRKVLSQIPEALESRRK